MERDMLKTENDKIRYLINNPHCSKEDILSHDWIKSSSEENELFLKCKKCGYYYGVIIFKSGMKARVFVPQKTAKKSYDLVCCKTAMMRKALE